MTQSLITGVYTIHSYSFIGLTCCDIHGRYIQNPRQKERDFP